MHALTTGPQRHRRRNELFTCLSSFTIGQEYPERLDPFGIVTGLDEWRLNPGSHVAQAATGGELLFCGTEGSTEARWSGEESSRIGVNTVLKLIFPKPFELLLENSSPRQSSRFLVLSFLQDSNMPEARTTESFQFSPEESRATLRPILSGQGHANCLPSGRDLAAYRATLIPGRKLIFETVVTRRTLVFLLKGALRIDNLWIHEGDTVRLWRTTEVILNPSLKSEVLLVDLA